MECRAAQRMIPSYIQRELKRGEQDEFLTHVKNCPRCYEELELYYTITMGIRELDGEEVGGESLQSMIDRAMKASRHEMDRQNRGEDLKIVISTVAFWFTLVAVLLELRIIAEFVLA